MNKVSICCCKWGNRYPASYVVALYEKVKENITYPFDFFCFTEDPNGLPEHIHKLDPGLSTYPPSMLTSGCWPKLTMFKEGVLRPDSITLYLDLDMMILGSLDVFIDIVQKQKGLHIIREWSPLLYETLLPGKYRRSRGGNSSIVGFLPSEQTHIYDCYLSLKERSYKFGSNDQQFITQFSHDMHFWPDDLVKSFRRHCVKIKPVGLVFPPEPPDATCHALIFHGKPDPLEVADLNAGDWGNRSRVGRGTVGWVRSYWKDYLSDTSLS